MHDTLTTLGLIVLTLLAAVACALAILRLRQAPSRAQATHRVVALLVWAVAAESTLLFLYRWLVVYHRWQPLEAHVDGLLLIAALIAVTAQYLQFRSRLPGLTAFILPVLTVVLAWGICASAWTFHPFTIGSAWDTLHYAGVYLGTMFFAIAAAAGAMFLMADKLLRHKRAALNAIRLGSLEAIERLMTHTATLGFALLTLGLVTGLIKVASGPTRLGPDWWYSPKILLGAAVWIIYALVMNVRYTTRFRGRRAALLSIAGMILLLATMIVAVKMADAVPPATDTTTHPTPEVR